MYEDNLLSVFSSEEIARFIKTECENRINKYGFKGKNPNACRGCKWKNFDKNNTHACCMFADIPADWEI